MLFLKPQQQDQFCLVWASKLSAGHHGVPRPFSMSWLLLAYRRCCFWGGTNALFSRNTYLALVVVCNTCLEYMRCGRPTCSQNASLMRDATRGRLTPMARMPSTSVARRPWKSSRNRQARTELWAGGKGPEARPRGSEGGRGWEGNGVQL